MSLMPPSSVRDRILEAARKKPAPTRDQAAARRRMVIAWGAAVSMAAFALIGSMGSLPRAFLFACAAGWSIVALATTLVGLARGPMMLGRPTRVLVVVAAALPVLVLGWVLAMIAWMKPPCEAPPMYEHAVCFAIGIGFAIAPLAAMLWVRRGTDPVHPGATGAALGAASGAWGGLLIHLHCPYADPLHMVLGHVLPIAVLAGIGVLLGRRVLGIRQTDA
jgi:hypothetical protein